MTLSNRQTDTWVDFEELRGLVGDKKTVQDLGWGTYTSYVNTSRDQKIVDLRRKGVTIKSVKLLPPGVRKNYVNSVPPSTLAIETCPARFRPLIAAITKAGGDDIHAKVSMEQVSNVLAEMPEDSWPSQFQEKSLTYWIQLACDGGWIVKGKVLGKKRMWLGSKVSLLYEGLRYVMY